jgi:hypothetical protein
MPRLQIIPCRYCTEREVGCHSICSKYQEWNKKREELRQKIYKEKLYVDFKK